MLMLSSLANLITSPGKYVYQNKKLLEVKQKQKQNYGHQQFMMSGIQAPLFGQSNLIFLSTLLYTAGHVIIVITRTDWLVE